MLNKENPQTYLKSSLRITRISLYHAFEKIFLKVLQRHAPIKSKTIRANHAPYVTKKMRKAIMKRTELQHRYVETKSSVKTLQAAKKFL